MRCECFFNLDSTQAMVQPFLAGQVAVWSSRGPHRTDANQDSCALLELDPHSGVLLVADGMGGHAAGELASRCAIEAMVREVIDTHQQGGLIRTGILNGFEQANQAVQQLGVGAGTTLAVLEIAHGYGRAYHAGDSVVLIVGSHGKRKLVTTSHSPVGFGLEAGLIHEDEAMSHDERHLVLNSVGCPQMRIEIASAVKLARQDTCILASDGLTDNQPESEIVDRLRKGPLEAAVERFARETQRRMTAGIAPSKPDDLTLVVARGPF